MSDARATKRVSDYALEEEAAQKRGKGAGQPFSVPSAWAGGDSKQVGGDLFVIGQGDCGQLGKGEDFVEAKTATLSSVFGKQITAVAAGGVHSVVLAEDGTVYTTGVNDEGALGRKTDNKLWTTHGSEVGPFLEAGSDYSWGQVAVPLTHGKPTAVSAGDSHSIVVTEGGAIWGWGTFRDSRGVYGFQPGCKIALLPRIVHEPTSAAEAVQQIVSGTDHVLARTAGNTVLSFGTGWQGQLGRIPKASFESFTAVETALKRAEADLEALEEADHNAAEGSPLRQKVGALKAEVRRARASHMPVAEALMGTQLRPGPIDVPFRPADIAAGWYSSFVLAESGRAVGFGLDNYGQATGQPADEASKDEERFIHSPVALRSLESRSVKAIASGIHHSLALTDSGEVLSFGRTTFGRLGRLNDEADKNVAREEPLPVDGLYGVTAARISAGEMVSACISDRGVAFAWGCGTNAQLGNGARGLGTRAAGLELAELTASQGEDEGLDELIAWRLDSAALRGREIVAMEFGGQHALVIARTR